MPENNGYVLARFDVSENGRPNNIQILESKPEENIAVRQQAKRTLRKTYYRPRFDNGKPASTLEMNIRYLFNDLMIRDS